MGPPLGVGRGLGEAPGTGIADDPLQQSLLEMIGHALPGSRLCGSEGGAPAGTKEIVEGGV